MPSQSQYNFPTGGGQEGVDSLRIKQALVDSFIPSELNSVVTQVRNPGFYESVAKVLASSYLPLRADSEGFSLTVNNNLVDQAIAVGPNGFSNENGALFNSALVIPNLQLISNFTQINFFNSNDNVVTDEIRIDCPISSMSYSYDNKYSHSSPTGYNGTIKELVGTSNLKITINGVFSARYLGQSETSDASLNMPNMREFQKMCMRNKVVTIDSDFIQRNTILNNFFQDCVIKNFSLPQDTTSKNLQRFTLTLESDKPLDII